MCECGGSKPTVALSVANITQIGSSVTYYWSVLLDRCSAKAISTK